MAFGALQEWTYTDWQILLFGHALSDLSQAIPGLLQVVYWTRLSVFSGLYKVNGLSTLERLFKGSEETELGQWVQAKSFIPIPKLPLLRGCGT